MNHKKLNRLSVMAIIVAIVALLMPAYQTVAYTASGNLADRPAHTVCRDRNSEAVSNDAVENASGHSKETGHNERKVFCDDFSSGTATGWEPQGGAWTVENGQYIGEGLPHGPCGGFSLNKTLVRNLEAKNIDFQVDMTSIQGVDKGIILRSTGPDNQIELNFRAERPGAFPADLVVQEIVNCQFILYTPEFSVPIPHQVGQTIHVRAKLVGNHLRVWINSQMVLDRSFPFAATKGQVGLAALDGEVAAFDNVRVKVLK
jgi:hypothetical protein